MPDPISPSLVEYCKDVCNEPALQTIKTKYDQPNRIYHNWKHIEDMLLLSGLDKLGQHKALILRAILLHDIVYDPTRSDNEEQSALSRVLIIPSNEQEIVSLFIQNTKYHSDKSKMHRMGGTIGQAMDYFLDLDLSILGENPLRYKEYAEAIRQEYSFIPDNVYREYRLKFLRKLLQSHRVYLTTWFQRWYEPQARINITREIKSLDF